MLINDNYKYPAKGMKEIKKPPTTFQDINPVYIEYANTLIKEEAQLMNLLGYYPMQSFISASKELQN